MTRRQDSLWFNLMMGALVCCAVIVTSLVVRREVFSNPIEDVPLAVISVVSKWKSFGITGHRLGPNDARVTIVEFVDFECPYCQGLALQLEELRARNPESIAIVFRHFPVPQHPNAVTAVRASECAADQGAFWEYHDALFARQDLIGIREWDDFARDADFDFDFELFNQCVGSRSPIPSLSQDTLAARELGVTGTPTALVNDKLVVGPAAIRREVVKALDAK